MLFDFIRKCLLAHTGRSLVLNKQCSLSLGVEKYTSRAALQPVIFHALDRVGRDTYLYIQHVAQCTKARALSAIREKATKNKRFAHSGRNKIKRRETHSRALPAALMHCAKRQHTHVLCVAIYTAERERETTSRAIFRKREDGAPGQKRAIISAPAFGLPAARGAAVVALQLNLSRYTLSGRKFRGNKAC